MTASLSHEMERKAYAKFASHDSEEKYRTWLTELYSTWRGYNADFFDGRLVEPHLTIGRTIPRRSRTAGRTAFARRRGTSMTSANTHWTWHGASPIASVTRSPYRRKGSWSCFTTGSRKDVRTMPAR